MKLAASVRAFSVGHTRHSISCVCLFVSMLWLSCSVAEVFDYYTPKCRTGTPIHVLCIYIYIYIYICYN
jgi:hypothetical protein